MKVLDAVVILDVPAERAWNALADFANIADFNPNLSASHLLEGSPCAGVGAMRQCDMKNGRDFIRERVTDWKPGRSYTVDILEGSMPLESAAATLAVRPLEAGGCEVRMNFVYAPKFGTLGELLDVVVLRRMLLGSCVRVLDGLGAYLTGAPTRDEAAAPSLPMPTA